VSAGKQRKSEQEEPPRPLRIVGKQFRDDLLDFLKEKKAVSNTTTTTTTACSRSVASCNQGVVVAIHPHHKQRILVSSCRLLAAAATPESKGFSLKNCRICRHARQPLLFHEGHDG
jgi:hypothetical protein